MSADYERWAPVVVWTRDDLIRHLGRMVLRHGVDRARELLDEDLSTILTIKPIKINSEEPCQPTY